ncbi:conserved hypothetical protein [Clostridioides difficile CD002]|nr:conserved hypothetical protein [Clostridioides difficile CD002]
MARQVFTYHLVNIKRKLDDAIKKELEHFTYHLVNIKQDYS